MLFQQPSNKLLEKRTRVIMKKHTKVGIIILIKHQQHSHSTTTAMAVRASDSAQQRHCEMGKQQTAHYTDILTEEDINNKIDSRQHDSQRIAHVREL